MTSNKTCLALAVFLIPVWLVGQSVKKPKGGPGSAGHALSTKYEDAKWQSMLPEMGNDSPQIAILRVDARTHATQLLIRAPKRLHVPLHWHSANETHTMIRGKATFAHGNKREQLGPGGFNYIPAKMRHEAWMEDDSLVFITVDSAWDVNWVSGPPTKDDLGVIPPQTPASDGNAKPVVLQKNEGELRTRKPREGVASLGK
jgi:quercetin dioxygenase-like cupin family protein